MKTVLKIAVIGILTLLISGFDTGYLVSREKPTYRKIYHTAQSGETLWGIAHSYGTTVSQLLKWNGTIKNPNLIYVGQKVRVA